MTKQDVIQKFIEACADPKNYSGRKLAVESQYNREAWEIYHKDGLIRITTLPVFQILIWPVFNKQEAPAGERNSARSFQLYEREYLSLKAIYFGRFQPDEKYLKKLSYEYSEGGKEKSSFKFDLCTAGGRFHLIIIIRLWSGTASINIDIFCIHNTSLVGS
jgi:hypothetical protein